MPPLPHPPPPPNILTSQKNSRFAYITFKYFDLDTNRSMPRDQRRKQYQMQIFITLFCLFPNKKKFCGSYLTPILFFLATCSQALEIFFPGVLFLGQFVPQIRYSHIIIIKNIYIFRSLYIKLKPQGSLIFFSSTLTFS